MAVKKIEIIYDIDGKAIDVAIDKTLNLQQQAKALTAELRKTKEGTAEFTLLTSKLNDAKDGLDRVSAKSRDLFAALSLLPGPVGSFFGQLNGVIGLMKTFTSFSIKDIGNQFRELGNDLRDIYKNLFGVAEAEKSLGDDTKSLTKDQEDLGERLNDNADAGARLNASLEKQTQVLQPLKKGFTEISAEQRKQYQNLFDLISAEDSLSVRRKKGIVQISAYGKEYRDLTEKENEAIASGRKLELTTDGTIKKMAGATLATRAFGQALRFLGVSANYATLAVEILETALMALGIGAIIAALVALFEVVKNLSVGFFEWATGITAANKELKKINETIEQTNTLLEMDEKSMKRRQAEYLAYLKSKGATDKQIREQGVKDLKEQLKLTQTAYGAISAEEQKLLHNKQATAEDIDKIQKRRGELDQKALDLQSQIKVAEFNNQTEINKQILEDQKKANEEAEKLRQKRIQDNKTADEALLTLKQENSVLYLKDERDKQYKELQNQAENEARKIEALDISEKKKEELRLQIYKKYGAKMIELANKFNEEDEKKLKEKYDKQLEWDSKLADMAVQSIVDQTEREKAEKQKKYNDDEADLKKALSENLITQKEYDDAIINLKKALNNDLKKIDDDKTKKDKEDRLKKLDDEIKFLQLQVDAEKNSFVAYYEDRQKLLDKSKQRELEAEDLTGAQKTAIEKKYVQLSKDLQREKFEAYVGYLNQGLGAAQSVLSQQSQITNLQQQLELDKLQLAFNKQQEFNSKTLTSKEAFDAQTVKNERELALQQDKVKEEYFYKNRAAQKAQAMISAFQAAISAYSSLAAIPVVGPFLGAAAAAVALAFGIKQANLIGQQQYVSSVAAEAPSGSGSKPEMANYGKNYGDGGMIEGPLHAQGGVAINAEGGEAVMTRGAVTMFQPLLSAMNQMGGGTSFSRGAAGQASFDNPKVSTPTMSQPQIIKTYVVSNELTSEAQKQAKLKNLSTL